VYYCYSDAFRHPFLFSLSVFAQPFVVPVGCARPILRSCQPELEADCLLLRCSKLRNACNLRPCPCVCCTGTDRPPWAPCPVPLSLSRGTSRSAAKLCCFQTFFSCEAETNATRVFLRTAPICLVASRCRTVFAYLAGLRRG
jgi:hypothetical protein